MIKVGLLYGGRSGEHEVSLCSAASVFSSLDRGRYEVLAIGIDKDGRWYVQNPPEIVNDKDFGKILTIKKTGSWLLNHFEDGNTLCLVDMDSGERAVVDVVFPVLHGTYGEDGTLQGLLELAMVPYVGADVLGSAVGMDKEFAKRLLKEAGIPVVPWITVRNADWSANKNAITQQALNDIGLPLFVKPVCAGSSVGITKVKDAALLGDAVETALQYDTRALIEKSVDCREIECSVIGNDNPEASVPGEIVPRHEFYSYEAKYIDPEGAALVIPASLDAVTAERVRRLAVEGYRALGCSGMARVDFFLEKSGSGLYLNEINTIPGFTSISMYPKLWEASGMDYSTLLGRLIDLAFERHMKRKLIKTEMNAT